MSFVIIYFLCFLCILGPIIGLLLMLQTSALQLCSYCVLCSNLSQEGLITVVCLFAISKQFWIYLTPSILPQITHSMKQFSACRKWFNSISYCRLRFILSPNSRLFCTKRWVQSYLLLFLWFLYIHWSDIKSLYYRPN